MDFPLIYCNGDSYSDDNYHQAVNKKTYPHVIAKAVNGFVINKSIVGSSNARIIRTSIADLIQERKCNPDQQIIAFIGLTFETRSEVWVDDIENNLYESNFVTHNFTTSSSWREDLLNDSMIEHEDSRYGYNKFVKHYNKGRAYFYNTYAERSNLMCSLVTLTSFAKEYNIDLTVFWLTQPESTEPEYYIDLFKSAVPEKCYLGEQFGMCDYMASQNCTSLDVDSTAPRHIQHYDADAHKLFANEILIPHLITHNIIPQGEI